MAGRIDFENKILRVEPLNERKPIEGSIHSLEEVSKTHAYVIWDLSAMTGPFGVWPEGTPVRERIPLLEESIDFFEFLRNEVNNERNFYTTKMIHDEAFNGKTIPLRKLCKGDFTIRNRNRKGITNGNMLRFSRLFKNRLKESRKTMVVFEENNRVLDLDSLGIPQYGVLPEKYSFRISEPDSEFVFSGVAIAQSDIPVALISNDRGIMHSWVRLMKREHIPQKLFNFYFRMPSENYLRPYVHFRKRR